MKGGREAFGFAALHIRDYSIYTPEVRTKEGADLEGDMNIAAAGCAFCHPERVRGISGLLSGSLLAALVRDDMCLSSRGGFIAEGSRHCGPPVGLFFLLSRLGRRSGRWFARLLQWL